MLQHVDILVLARPSWKEGNGDHRERGCGFRKYNRNGNCNKTQRQATKSSNILAAANINH